MSTVIDVEPIGGYYTWLQARDFGWKWNNEVCVVKTWLTFIQLNWSATVTEPVITITAPALNHPFKAVSDSVNVDDSDAVVKDVTKNLATFFRIADEHAITEFILRLSEIAVGISDSSVLDIGKVINQTFSLFEETKVDMDKSLAEAISVSESYQNLVTFIRNFDATIALAEANTKDVTKHYSEPLYVSESGLTKDVDKNILRNISFLEEQTRKWLIQIIWTEYFFIRDSRVFDMTARIANHISFREENVKDMVKEFTESITVVEDFLNIVVFNKLIDEGFTIQDASAKAVTLALEDRFSILEEFLKGGGEAVISDLRVLAKALTDAEFEELITQTSPTGYGPFIPFIAGDYEYQEALYKVVMTSRNASRPYLEQVRYEVDLPDVFDQGEVSITTSRQQIDFNRTFNQLPDVIVVVKGGGLNYVPIVDVDVDPSRTHFFVDLRQPVGAPSPGAFIAATISWKAQGI